MRSAAVSTRGLLALLLLVVLAACSSGQPTPPGRSTPPGGPAGSSASPSAGQGSPGGPGVTEQPTSAWKISARAAAWGIPWRDQPTPVVSGFTSLASVAPGESFQLFVSSTAPKWRVTAYRMGWYGGLEGAQVWRSGWQRGVRQPAAITTGSTHTPSAPWHPSLTVSTTGWRPGSYLLRLDAPGGANYVPLTVRSTSTAGKLVLLTPDTNWQAYNDWGGRNLYWGPNGKGDAANRARAVSFDRPYSQGLGASEYLDRMLPVVALAEQLKLPLAYADDVDLEAHPGLLTGAAGVISMGHDEYWSLAMRKAVTAARDAGTNLAFLGANAVYRRIRLEPSSLGKYRIEVNYKVASEDPMSTTHPSLTTANWPDPPDADPERSLTGEAYGCFPASGDLVVEQPTSWLLAGTGLTRGSRITGAVGPEVDAVAPQLSMPRPLDVVFHSPVACPGTPYADATYYVATSGAGVFDTGTMGWVHALRGGDGKATQGSIRRITATLLTAFAQPRAGRAHPALDTVTKVYPSVH
ncbi:MAG TPA: N,N-dimethylformamidase beta subunit family domain-containing protein [Propionibacteriaceae bacterium]|nr:N,N-dimethylformamidase beta subunit family domain-containing protein [Propionibacteriaceae bacterium]